MIENTEPMIELTFDESNGVDGGLSWCKAAFIGGVAAFAGGLTGGSGIFLGAEIGALGAMAFCD